MEQEGAAGLMKIGAPPPALYPTKEVLSQQSIPPGMVFTIKAPTLYKHATVVFHGDGDFQIILRVFIGAEQFNVGGAEFNVLTVANNTLEIRAENTDPNVSRITPKVEILSLSWG
jgi:hypothetical protein